MPKVKSKSKVVNNSIITQFFGKAESSTEKSEIENKNLDFYESCLSQKVGACENEKNCNDAIDNLGKKRDTLRQKLSNIEKAQIACLKVCHKKEEKIKILQDDIQLQKSNNDELMKQRPVSTNATKPKKVLFEMFKDDFSEEQLGTLRSNSKKPRGDSTFILNSVRFSYCDDLEKIQQKSLKGLSDKREAISPIKLNRMELLFKEHLTNCELEEEEKINREKKFGRHVHRAIMNINTKLENTAKNKKVIHVAKE